MSYTIEVEPHVTDTHKQESVINVNPQVLSKYVTSSNINLSGRDTEENVTQQAVDPVNNFGHDNLGYTGTKTSQPFPELSRTPYNLQGNFLSADITANGKNMAPDANDKKRAPAEEHAITNDDDLVTKPLKPMWICRMICHHPWKSLGVAGGVQVSFVVINAILFAAGYDILPINFRDAPLQIQDSKWYLNGMAWLARDDAADMLPELFSDVQTPLRTFKAEPCLLNYEDKSGNDNVFTAENLKGIQQAENAMLLVSGFDQHCYSDITGKCIKPMSIVNFFDGTYGALDPIFQDNPEFAKIPHVLQKAMDYEITRAQLVFHLGNDYKINGSVDIAQCSITRSMMWMGLPLDGYTSVKDREDDQLEKIEDFLSNEVTDQLWSLNEKGVGTMEFTFNGLVVWFNDRARQIMRDFVLAVASFVFITLFIIFQTRSLLITATGMIGIMTSFCSANLVYRIVLDFRYFGIFHVLSVFIMLGIGADNIFIFYDTWRQSARTKFVALEYRLSYVYRRASAAMLVTSLTTAIALFANMISKQQMINTFGLLTGIVVMFNYLTVITLLPCVVVIHHLKWKDWTWPCCRCLPCGKDEKDKVPPTVSESNTQTDHVNTTSTGKPNIIIRFFSGPYSSIVMHKVLRWFIIAGFLGLIGFFTYRATKISPQSDRPKIFRDTHQYGKARLHEQHSFIPSFDIEVMRVYIVWGMKAQDRSSCHRTDFECEGESVWDEGFDLNPAPAQMAMLRFCESLKSLSIDQSERMRIRRDVYGDIEAKCFMQNMNEYMTVNEGMEQPLNSHKVGGLMSSNDPGLYNASVINDVYYRYFETAANYWLTDGYTSPKTYTYDDYSELIGEILDRSDSHKIRKPGVFNNTYYGTRLRYAAVVVNTTMYMFNHGFEEGFPVRDAWEEFLEEQKEYFAPSTRDPIMCTPEKENEWHWLDQQYELVQSAWQGIAVGISASLVIITLATRNYILGILATVTICFVTVSVVGIINLAGWFIGPLEAGNLALLVGLAVDYCVHLAEGYHFSKHQNRRGRVHDMLSEVGVSVISGASTTIGASIFLLFAQIQFFYEFGLLMISTIGLSMLYSLGLFSTVLAIIGPEGDTGSIMPLFNRILSCFTSHSSASR